MIFKKNRINTFFILWSVFILCGLSASVAFAVVPFVPSVQKMDAGTDTLYGQTLDFGKVYYPEGSFSWKQLKGSLPEVLPEADAQSKSSNELCKHMNLLYRLYSKDNVAMINELARELEEIKPPKEGSYDKEDPFSPYYVAVASRLYSSSKKASAELFANFPSSYKDRLIVAQTSVKSELLISYVYDAAIHNCSEHAKKQGYALVYTAKSAK